MKFIETQRLTQIWLWVILISIAALLLFGGYFQIIEKKQFGDKPPSNTAFIIIVSLHFIFIYFMYKLKLITQIDENAIKIKFVPFFFSREYKWNQISKIYIKKYSPIKDFGGYGIRYGFSKKGFIMGGKFGIHLELISGEKIVISTQDEKKLQEVINKLIMKQ